MRILISYLKIKHLKTHQFHLLNSNYTRIKKDKSNSHFQANRLIIQDLLDLDYEKNIFKFNLLFNFYKCSIF